MQSNSQQKRFDMVVDLVRHMCEELVDDPDSLEIVPTIGSGTTGAIEICGPTREVAKIMGSRRKTFHALKTIVFAVASKYGFKIIINILNHEQRDRYQNGGRESDVPLQDGSLMID